MFLSLRLRASAGIIFLGLLAMLLLTACQAQPGAWSDTWLKAVKADSAAAVAFPPGQGGEVYFVPDDQVLDLRQAQATVAAIQPCRAFFRTSEGQVFCIGNPASKWQGFARSLKVGQGCNFPDAVREYQKNLER